MLSEREALQLEASLIGTLRPRYNQRLKHSRGYPFLRIDKHGATPNAALTVTLRDDGAAYFGPFPETGRTQEALTVIRRIYLLHPGAVEGDPSRQRANLRRMTSQLLALLEGHGESVQERIEQAMHAAAGALDFERAGRLRATLATCGELACAPRVDARRGASDPPRERGRITVELPCACGAPWS